MQTAAFHFNLPQNLIANHPAERRDQSRLLVLRREKACLEHGHFFDLIRYLQPGDVLVVNDSRVIPARLQGEKAGTGGRFELLLVEQNEPNDWWAMVRPGGRARIGTTIMLKSGGRSSITATVSDVAPDGQRRLKFSGTPDIMDELERLGEVPLPPYIKRAAPMAEDRERYQTVFAQPPGSVAAPTAGLHFTSELLAQIRSLGVGVCAVTLHVGPGTFLPVKTENPLDHKMHAERFAVGPAAVNAINRAKEEGRRVIAVGTTTVRALESVAAANDGRLNVYAGKTNIFILPPFRFQIADALLTNFHLPCSTLLMLVSAFAAPGETNGRDVIFRAYDEAIRNHYRFFSYGDAMLIL
ncbi:MAG: tRNA preQ1(34) S-adenosylmethionine ribosyltransferase-isomerase QueA [Verrucomicrobia bacterium]|nr:tRNA preQ1(34) S-adenosylmethionine ribosyltransferase-isomerase QueA [Verrucomicrobiota bacterium]MDE3099373.1 tRNA preQ1(34) S-adenosylmethionine ribosyltransferase-isomerase QueA [Verrucomicrobiota bacterium]